MPTDPHSTRKASPGSIQKKKSSTAHKASAHSKNRGAEEAQLHHKKKPQTYRSDNAPARNQASRAEYYASDRVTNHGGVQPARAPRQSGGDAARYAYDARYGTPKKKKKSKFKRFWKNLGKELKAVFAKLVQVKELPPEQAARDARGDFEFSQSKKASANAFFGKAKKGLLAGVRAAARGIFLGVRGIYRYLMKLPSRTLLIASSAFGLAVVAIIVLALALPGKPSESDGAEQLAAYTALETEPTALDSTAIDPTQADATTDGASVDVNTPDGQAQETIAGNAAETAAEPVFTAELHEGDNGEIVTTLQTKLMELGYMDSDEPTQHFGPLTQNALKTFQRHNGLDDDGICGQATYELLMSGTAKIYVMQLGDSGPDVEGIQQRLYELGYLDNKANIQGVFGEKTEEAAKAFQKKNDLTADGKVGNKTLEMLYGEEVVGNAFHLGDENPVIEDCQAALKKLGFITFKPDGVMGKSTVSAIKAFQQANGLTRDGALGPVTRDLILSGDAQEMVMQLGDYGSDVKHMQEQLAKLNYLAKANATGYFGEITQDAVKAFQKRMGLTSDGKVGGVTLSIMVSSKAKKAVSTPSATKESTSGSSSSSSSSGSSSSGGTSIAVANSSGVDKLIALAQSKIGCKYVRGAKGPNSFDCSGFVYWCLKEAGVSTSYMTSIAWRSTSRFQQISSMGSIQSGDILVFSGSTANDGHVGIYIGGGKMIDASSSEGQVRQSSSVLNSGGYWSSHFICAYRVF